MNAPLSASQRRHLAALAHGPLRGRTQLAEPDSDDPDARSGIVTVLDRLVAAGLARLAPGSWNGTTFAYEITPRGLLELRLADR